MFLAAAVFGALSATDARAAVPLGPTAGSTTTSTPSFSWQLAPGEQSYVLEITPNPATGSDGRFADDDDLRFELLDENQTTFAVGDADPLFAGTWFWHVETRDDDFNAYRTQTLSFQVPDERPVLKNVDVDYLACLREVSLDFEFTDNSRDPFVRWQLDFLRKRTSGKAARVSGTVDDEFAYESIPVPKRLKMGRRYWVRLRIIDPAGNKTLSKPRGLKLERC